MKLPLSYILSSARYSPEQQQFLSLLSQQVGGHSLQIKGQNHFCLNFPFPGLLSRYRYIAYVIFAFFNYPNFGECKDLNKSLLRIFNSNPKYLSAVAYEYRFIYGLFAKIQKRIARVYII